MDTAKFFGIPTKLQAPSNLSTGKLFSPTVLQLPYGFLLGQSIDKTKRAPQNSEGNTGWIFYGNDGWVTMDFLNSLPEFSPDDYNAALDHQRYPKLTMKSGQLVGDPDTLKRLVKLAAYKYQLPPGTIPTSEEVADTYIIWVPQRDFWDENRGILSTVVGVAGAALAPLTAGASLAASGLIAKSVMSNGQGQPVASVDTSYNPSTGKQTTSINPVVPSTQNPTSEIDKLLGNDNTLLYFFLGFIVLIILILLLRK